VSPIVCTGSPSSLFWPAPRWLRATTKNNCLNRIERLERRVAELEARAGVAPPVPSVTPKDLPSGAQNLLRAYDVASNSFSLNQAALIVERTPNLQAGGVSAHAWTCGMDKLRKRSRGALSTSPAVRLSIGVPGLRH
jgi:hypothetical protein